MIIGITGTKASGKGIVAEILKEKGFDYFSTSDAVRMEAKSRGLENYTISDLQEIGNDLRERYGPSALVQRCLQGYDGRNLIIDSIRNPSEVRKVQEEEGIVIGVDAPIEDRFKRILARNRASDPKTLEGFLEMDKRDRGDGESEAGQQVDKCIGLADYQIFNNASLETLKTKVEYILIKEGQQEIYRPTWDEMFMFAALGSAARASCQFLHTGAVIVKDKRIIATGYNGAPQGIENCLEAGCRKKKKGIGFNEKGTGFCMGEHGERNALLQISRDVAKGATMYSVLYPCGDCAKQIIGSGISEVVWLQQYVEPDDLALDCFQRAGTKVRQMNPSFFQNYVQSINFLLGRNQELSDKKKGKV